MTERGGPDPQMRLILFGGGHGDDSREPDCLFGAWVGPGGHVLVIVGTGQHTADIERDVERLAGYLRETGVSRLTVWDAAVIEAPGFVPELSPFDGVCFIAPLPHQIVPLLRRSGLDRALADAARAGCVLYVQNLLTPLLGPDLRFTAIRDYDITDHGIDDTAGLGLTTDDAGVPTVYLGIYRALPTGNRRHPQRIANATGARVCTIPAASTVAIRDGEIRQIERRPFGWYDPKRQGGS